MSSSERRRARLWCFSLLAFAAGCERPAVEPVCEATFARVAHAAPAVGETRVHDSGELLIPELRYGEASPWLQVNAGAADRAPYSMEFVSAESGLSVAHSGFSPYCEYIYTVVLSSPEQHNLFWIYHHVPFDEDISNYPPNTWKLGVIHAAPEAGPVRIRTGVDESWTSNRLAYSFETAGAMNPGTDSVWIRDDAENLLLATTVTGAVGESWMIVLMDAPGGGIQALVWDHQPDRD